MLLTLFNLQVSFLQIGKYYFFWNVSQLKLQRVIEWKQLRLCFERVFEWARMAQRLLKFNQAISSLILAVSLEADQEERFEGKF